MADKKFDRKYHIAEEIIEETLAPIIPTITEEFHQSIRDHFQIQIYRPIKQSKRIDADDDVQSSRDRT